MDIVKSDFEKCVLGLKVDENEDGEKWREIVEAGKKLKRKNQSSTVFENLKTILSVWGKN